jgi:hypothetical protein
LCLLHPDAAMGKTAGVAKFAFVMIFTAQQGPSLYDI